MADQTLDLDLDDLAAVSTLDRADMLGEITAFDKQCLDAVDIGRRAELEIDPAKVTNIIVMGMGGSAISGDVSRILFEDELRVPLFVNRGYRLPAFAGPGTLAIAASYSGDTEETLSGFEEALSRGAQAVVVSSGGRISRIAADKKLSQITIPGGKQPRASLGYLSIPLAILLERLGFVGNIGPALDETIGLLCTEAARYRPEVPLTDNPAKQLAHRLLGKMPVVYGSEGITGLAAFRFKCQLNENSKSPAVWNVFPELNHNEITGWQELPELSRHFRLICLRDEGDHVQIGKRVEATRELIVEQFAGAEEVWSGGESKLARLFSLIYLGDFASAYLALLNGIDPSPVERIESLKKRLLS